MNYNNQPNSMIERETMKTEEKITIPRVFIIVTVAIGLLLSAFSIASGNNPLINPDLTVYQQQLQNDPVTAEQLANSMIEGKRNFLLAGFRDADDCSVQKKITKLLKCHNREKLNDTRWIRKTFKNINMPLIVYGSQTNDGLKSAAQLMHFGYDVSYLEGGFDGFAFR
jgi:hypothetical protein